MQKRVIVFSLLFSVIQFEANANMPFDLMDTFELEWATDPRVSPDGNSIVYVRRSNDIMTDDQITNLWQLSIDGEDHRILTSGLNNPKSPRWSPDNSRLAFLSNDDYIEQIYIRWLDTGETGAISKLQESPSNLTWSPDGKWLAFTMSVKVPNVPIVPLREKPEGAEWSEEPITVTMTQYQYDGSGIVEPAYPVSYTHLRAHETQ